MVGRCCAGQSSGRVLPWVERGVLALRMRCAHPYLHPYFSRNNHVCVGMRWTELLVTGTVDVVGHPDLIYTIFEGTSEIQRLIISWAISGVHIQ